MPAPTAASPRGREATLEQGDGDEQPDVEVVSLQGSGRLSPFRSCGIRARPARPRTFAKKHPEIFGTDNTVCAGENGRETGTAGLNTAVSIMSL